MRHHEENNVVNWFCDLPMGYKYGRCAIEADCLEHSRGIASDFIEERRVKRDERYKKYF